MMGSTRLRVALAVVVGLFVLAAAWVGWQVWQVDKDLSAAVHDATAVKSAVDDGDQQALGSALTALERDSGRASRRTSGWTWSVLTHVPAFGDDARGVRVTSQVLSGLAADGVAPLARVYDHLDTLLPRDGAIDAGAIGRLQQPVAQAQAAFSAADATLSSQDPSGFIGPLRRKFVDFRDQVGQGDRAMSAATTATGLLPTLLGEHGPRSYLLVFQNNAEIRATGGLPGAVAEIGAVDGKLTITRQAAGSALGMARRPVLPLTAAEKSLYGGVFGQYFVDANFTPDVPRAADLMRARWRQAYPADRIDGVLLVDTVSLGYLMDATGPVDIAGVRLTGDNLVEELLSKAYARLTPKQQDAFFAGVAKTVFDRFTGSASNGSGVVRALTKGVSEGRIFAHFFDAGVQDRIAGSQLAGDLLSNPATDRPQVAITFNDTTGSKMSYYLRYQVDANATYCTNGVQALSVKAHLQSTAPADAATSLPKYVTGSGDVKRGDDLITVRFFGPVGGSIGRLTWNDQPMSLIRTTEAGRPVAMTYVELAPGQIVDLGLTMESGPGQTGATDLMVTPTIQRADGTSALPSAC